MLVSPPSAELLGHGQMGQGKCVPTLMPGHGAHPLHQNPVITCDHTLGASEPCVQWGSPDFDHSSMAIQASVPYQGKPCCHPVRGLGVAGSGPFGGRRRAGGHRCALEGRRPAGRSRGLRCGRPQCRARRCRHLSASVSVFQPRDQWRLHFGLPVNGSNRLRATLKAWTLSWVRGFDEAANACSLTDGAMH